MKTFTLSSARRQMAFCCVVAALLSSAIQLRAQSAVSNLGQGTSGSANIGAQTSEVYRRTFSFTTGASVGGYDFTGFTMAFSGSTGSPGSLTVGLYSSFTQSLGSSPTGLLASLSLSAGNPASAGNATFTGSTSLAASTTYYVFLSAPSAISGENRYTFPTTAAPGSIDSGGLAGWSIGSSGFASNAGNAWIDGGVGTFSIQASASAIPEPSTYAAIAGAAMLGLAVWQRRRRVAVSVE